MTTTPDFRALCAELLSALEIEAYAHWATDPDEDLLVKRAQAALATPPPEPPTDEELWATGEDYLDDTDRTYAIKFARAVLEKWGNEKQ